MIHLEIAEPQEDRFKLVGVTWIGSLGIAPFEIDLELNPNEDTYFARTAFRIGILDNHGLATVAQGNLAPTRVIATRPRYNREWAMAIELTPPGIAPEQSGSPKLPVGREFES